ncbi:hypothetical protein RSP795_06680 [Ralstonia solanacearum]|uniref:hypothetical protein n=1 Tax=Ralstonia solanacearum TaxID=305 RepID=UPI0007D80399|nr:hypothetical protein [Ralstonia solanacearum]OAI63871.1 hypothetical protein RSP795_06680 [Ralstonia solanacearum]
MTTPILTRYDFSLPVAQRLSDLTGIKIDLQAVEKVCDRLFEERDKRVLDPQGDINAFVDAVFYSDTLYAAAVVRFMRTQATGSRIGIPVEWIDALPGHLRAVYSHVKDLRDKFIAHPVAPLEDNQVLVYVKISGEEAGTVTDVNLDHGRMLTGGGVDGFALGKLAKALREKVESEIDIEAARVLEAARAMPITDIIKRGCEQVAVPSMQWVSKGRKPFSGK